jgi:chemotaxis protein MotA
VDKLSLLGIALGLAAIVGGHVLEHGLISALFQPTAFLIVAGGTLGAILLQTPAQRFLRGVKLLKWVFVPPVMEDRQQINLIVQWSLRARREGLLALENALPQIRDPFLHKGLQLLVDGASPEHLREVMEVEISTYEEEMRQSARIWDSAGGYSPTIGILGAVLGLIQTMTKLTEPKQLGAGIAVAFVATIYGVGFANLIYLPIANKLKTLIARQVSAKEMLLDGLEGIAQGDNPHLIESRLESYQFRETVKPTRMSARR